MADSYGAQKPETAHCKNTAENLIRKAKNAE